MAAANVKDEIIVDGTSGHVYLNPDAGIKKEYVRLEQEYAGRMKELEGLRDLPAVTTDGVAIILSANIGLISDVRVANLHGAEGVGLYRTEFPYMARSAFPSREEQAGIYRKILEGFPGQTVNIRTLDIGGDKGAFLLSVSSRGQSFPGVALDSRLAGATGHLQGTAGRHFARITCRQCDDHVSTHQQPG